MGIFKVSQIGPGRRGKAFNDFNRDYTVPFQVIVTDARDGLFVVGGAVDPNTGVRIPPRYWPYIGYENGPGDVFALCTDLDIGQDPANWQKWTVDVKFETNYQTQKQEDPEDDPVIYWVEKDIEQLDEVKEWDGTPIVNSSGQLYQGIKGRRVIVSHCFLRNELQPTPLFSTYNGALNSVAYQVSPQLKATKYTLQLEITVDKPQRRSQYFYYPHTYKMAYKQEGWPIDPVDRGTAVIRTVPPLLPRLGRPIDADNQPIDGEVNLDGNGNMLAANAQLVFLSGAVNGIGNGTGKPKFLTQPLPFSALNLQV